MPENTQDYTYTQRLNDLLWEVSSIDDEANDDFSSITLSYLLSKRRGL